MKSYCKGISHAKIILIGEHSAVYGQPSIVLPLTNLNIVATIKSINNGQTIHSRYYNGKLSDAPQSLLGVKTLILKILKKFNQVDTCFDLKIESKIPSECGMGSSAAASIAITRALFNFFNQPLSHSELLRESNIEEEITHGNPSGMDAAAASYDSPIWFVHNQPIKRIPFNAHGTLIIAYSGIQSKTNNAVNLVHKKLISKDKHVKIKNAINKLGKLAKSTKKDLKNGDLNLLGQNMNDAQMNLKILGVSIPKIDRLITVGRNAGALGAKLTGSGLGGCVIFIAIPENVNYIVKKLKNAGANQIWIQHF